ncbi:unnamed protein product [Larinioides sclopetarius]|uniref:C2H2-type domain-containing protein n=1 Tax=Larinioides sclopetarius TaxID=280406 RepID=A0AAV2C074_9ARAC
MGRYLCHGCFTIVNYGEDDHPCFFYKNDDAVYTIPQFEEMDANHCETREEYAGNSNDDHGNICETTEETRNNSPALTSPSHSVSSIENKDNKLSRDFTDRPSSSEEPFNSPNRKGSPQVRQQLELQKEAGAVAGPSAVHPHSLAPGGERRYACNECPKQFKYSSGLSRHHRTHNYEKPFVCDTCGKEFTQKANLTTHGRTHTGEKLFACDTCGRKFSRKQHLQRHMRTHTGEKLFACDTCGRKFSRKQHLERHMRTHTGEMIYVCDICGKSFGYGKNFKKHVVTHKGGRRYTCSVCGETFGSNEDRNRHIQEKHQ